MLEKEYFIGLIFQCFRNAYVLNCYQLMLHFQNSVKHRFLFLVKLPEKKRNIK